MNVIGIINLALSAAISIMVLVLVTPAIVEWWAKR